MNRADTIWNRAAMERGGNKPAAGDAALAALLYAHGLVMNGGVLYGVELMKAPQLAAADAGYRFFGLDAAADLLQRAKKLLRRGGDLDEQEALLDAEYMACIPNDSALVRRFEKHLATNPADFSPL
jgi:hypothetical protein